MTRRRLLATLTRLRCRHHSPRALLHHRPRALLFQSMSQSHCRGIISPPAFQLMCLQHSTATRARCQSAAGASSEAAGEATEAATSPAAPLPRISICHTVHMAKCSEWLHRRCRCRHDGVRAAAHSCGRARAATILRLVATVAANSAVRSNSDGTLKASAAAQAAIPATVRRLHRFAARAGRCFTTRPRCVR